MRRLLFALATSTVLTGGLLAGTAAAALAATGPVSPYIVVFKDNTDTDTQTNRLQGDFGFAASFRYSHAIHGFAARLTAGQVAAISRLPFVQFVGIDGTVTLDDTANLAAGETVPTGVRRIGAATSVVVHTASTVNVAIIDTGEQLNNPDLNVVSGKNCITTGQQANDDNGHGTHVAGTIGGRNNGSTVPGVAAGTKIYAVKVLNSAGSGSFSQIVCGIDWVTANATSLNIKVASMSLGGSGSNDNNCGNSNFDSMHAAICRSVAAGVTYVVAAGNSSANFASSVPASYPEVLTVTAFSDSDGQAGGFGGRPACRTSEGDDTYASFSNFAVNPTEVNHTIAGPGVCILSDWPTNSTNTISGTSMATPHVSAAVALCFGQNGNNGPCTGLTPAQIIQKMRSDAAARASAAPGYGFAGDPQDPLSGRYYGNLVWVGGDLPTGTATAPTAPSLTSATAGNGSVALNWTSPSDGGSAITNYKIYRGLSAGNEGASPLVVVGNTTTYTDSGLINGTTYFYKVAAVNAVNTGPQSNERSATPQNSATAPGAPSLTSANPGNGSVALAWSAPGSNGGSAITGYKVFRGTSAGNEFGTPIATLGNVLAYTDPGLTNGTTYYYTVAAVNAVNTGPQSNERSATPTGGGGGGGATAPGAPTLTAVGRGFTHGINLSWNVPNNNGSPITGYQIFRAASSSGPFTQITTVGTGTTYTDTGNPTYRTSYYQVVAVNAVGPGPASNTASAFSF